jgi:putative copper resistance protein D
VIAFIDVLLRGLALCAQALAVGGVPFLLVTLRGETGAPAERARARATRLVVTASLALAAAQATLLVAHLATLADEHGWPVADALTTTYFTAGLLRTVGAVGLALVVPLLPVAPAARRVPVTLTLGLAVGLIATAAWMSHAAARLADQAALFVLDFIHQTAAAVWIGGLGHLVCTAVPAGAAAWPLGVLRRFSATALLAVAVLVVTGAALSWFYVGDVGGLVGTAYGLMVQTKLVMLAGLLLLGALNYRTVRRAVPSDAQPLRRLRSFVEVEVGLGLTVLFVAASLTSLPPSADVVADRATPAEVASQLAPAWPRLTSPAHAELPAGDRDAPRTAADRAWSDYNHNVAGLFVLAMGGLASLEAFRGARWARHWPLVFLGLGAFMLVRSDPGAWPLGPVGFWEGFTYPSVVQHRLFVALVGAFGLFEWAVRTGRAPHRGWAYAFPVMAVIGGGLLLTHSHALENLKVEFLTEVTHAPLGILALAVGWGRWLELRMGPPGDRLPRRIWAGALTLVGLLLLTYHES